MQPVTVPHRRLRVVLVAESFYPRSARQHDPGTRSVRALVDHLVDAGHEPAVVAAAPGLDSYRGARIVRIGVADRPGRQVRAALEALRPDLVHVVSPGRIGARALKHARALGVPTVACQADPLGDRAAERFATKIAPRADRVVTTCGWMADRVRELGAPDAFVWRPGVDVDAFSPALRGPARDGSAARDVVVGFVGPLERRSVLRPLVAAAAVPGGRLVAIGDGARRDWLAQRAPGTRFTGALGTGDRAAVLASLDLLVHPGEDLTCAHALREAAASGLPVVASRAGGARELVRHLETGLLVDDRRGFADAVAALVADRRRGDLGAAAREQALTRSWSDACADLVSGAWESLLASAADGRADERSGRGLSLVG